MWNRKIFIASIILLTLFISSMTFVVAQDQFSVSPGDFTVHDAPPMGTPYTISQSIVVWNRDNIARQVYVTSEIPENIPENDILLGYEPIPNENWVIPLFRKTRSSIENIPENSYAIIDISFNIPRWENLTSQKWEVWIPVERQPVLIDNVPEPVVYRPTVRMKIETTKELPAVGKGISYYLALLISVILVIVTIVVVAWILSRSKG